MCLPTVAALWVSSAMAQAPPSWPVLSYVTESFHPAQLVVNKTGPTASGYLLLAAEGESASANPVIMADSGDLIWQSELLQADGSYGDNSMLYMNVDIQQLDGTSYLTYFNGTPSGNHAYGSVHVLDASYTEAYRVCVHPENVVLSSPGLNLDCFSDMHESQFTNRGTILVSLYNVTRANLTPVGGPKDGWILDSQFYEVDIKTNAVKFVWKSLEHQQQISITLTHWPLTVENQTSGGGQYRPFDYFHINSVTLMPDGGYLVSSRHLWSVIKLSATGDVEWILPGNGSNSYFADVDPRIRFSWQHHARVSAVTSTGFMLHIHNNANSEVDYGNKPTSGLLMQLDLANPQQRSATLLHNYTNPAQPVFSFAEGSYQALPNSNVLLGHGYVPQLVEFSETGQVVMVGQYGPLFSSANSYRNFRYPWTGTPSSPPKAKFANDTASARKLYMSWNGATEYDHWLIYAGPSQSNLTLVGRANRTGFETSSQAVTLPHGYAQVAAAAQGKILSKSPVLKF